ncbi:cellulase family glycosylhydrolase [Cellulomonas sp. KRMCY2]|uniref:cellulase family glycosylhydrolase n=1 Tax=Cellulomonas sp. KRMCY2 TaxID=1304865 RepID=UPI0004ADB0D6|nr:cellulase family glycosylhydrolase [Cellulomonas sp. KRMCY2]
MSARRRAVVVVLVALFAFGAGLGVYALLSPADGPGPEFVTRDGDQFMLDGEPFYAAGSNNYRPMFLDPTVVDQIMAAVADNDHRVLRAWAFNDIGDPADPTTSIDPQNTTTYFHSWDPAAEAPAFNDGETGLEQLDYMVASAKEHGVRLVLPFVNNWGPYGGMDQYVRWAGAEFHSDFYTDATIRQWYKDWVEHLLNRVNTITGVAYKDEPTIMAWELANEPRCVASGSYEAGPDCTTDTLTAWATEMAAFVKSVDGNHLVGLGDEGFWCEPDGEHWTDDCSQGVDARAIAQLEDIDMVGLHLYPDHWDTTVDWSEQYVIEHVALAADVDKPVFIGEYGWRGDAPRSIVFHQWMSAYFEQGGDVALYWLMQPRDQFTTPPDSDGFTAYCPSAVCTQVGQWTRAVADGDRDQPPVAEVDVLVATEGVRGLADLLANDVSLFSELDPTSVDLDPEASGVQDEVTSSDGVARVADGVLTYEPAEGFVGRSEVSYTVADVDGLVSEPVDVTVRVNAAE